MTDKKAAKAYAESCDNQSGSFLQHQLEAIRAKAFIAGLEHGRLGTLAEPERVQQSVTDVKLTAESLPAKSADQGPFVMSRYASKDDLINGTQERIAELELEVANGVKELYAAREKIDELKRLDYKNYQDMKLTLAVLGDERQKIADLESQLREKEHPTFTKTIAGFHADWVVMNYEVKVLRAKLEEPKEFHLSTYIVKDNLIKKLETDLAKAKEALRKIASNKGPFWCSTCESSIEANCILKELGE